MRSRYPGFSAAAGSYCQSPDLYCWFLPVNGAPVVDLQWGMDRETGVLQVGRGQGVLPCARWKV